MDILEVLILQPIRMVISFYLFFSLTCFLQCYVIFNVEVVYVFVKLIPKYLYCLMLLKLELKSNFIFQMFAPIYKNTIEFYNIDFVSCELARLPVSSSSCFADSWDFLCKQSSYCEQREFYFFLFWFLCFYFLSLPYCKDRSWKVQSSVNRSGETRYPYLVHNLREKVLNLSSLKVSFFTDAFYQMEEVSFCSQLNFVRCSFSISWDGHVVFSFNLFM